MIFTRAFMGALIIACTTACAEKDVAQLLVVVSSDLSVPAQLDAIEIRLRDASGEITIERAVPLDAGQPLPVSFGVAPEGDDVARPVDVEIAARLGGADLFRTRVRTGFIARKKLRLDIFLAASCIAAACGDTASCFGGFCTGPIDIPATSLPETGGDAFVFDAGNPGDAGDAGDAGGGDARPDVGDAGPDSGESCTIGRDLIVDSTGLNRVFAEPAVAWNGSEFALAWVDFNLTTERGSLAFARVAGDGDRRIDQGWARFDTTLTGTTASPETTSLMWTGTDWAAVWSDARPVRTAGRVFFARLTAASTTATELSMLVDRPDNYVDQPAVAFDGTSFGVAWREDYAFGRFTLVSATGTPSGTVVDIGDGAFSELLFVEPQREWALLRARYVADDDDELQLLRLLDDGRTIADPTPPGFPNTTRREAFPSLVWTGSEYGAMWLESRGTPDPWDVAFTRLANDGTTLMPFARAASPALVQYPPVLGYTSSLGFGVFWWDDFAIRFARLRPDGSVRAMIARINAGDGGASSPAIAGAGDLFGVAWVDFSALHFTTISCR